MSSETPRPRQPRTKVTGPQGRLPEQALPLPAPAPFGSWAERKIARARLNSGEDPEMAQEIREALVQVAAEADRLWDGIARRAKGAADDPDLRAEIIAMIRSLEGVWARERHEAVDVKWARRSAARAAAWGAAAAALEQLDPFLQDQLSSVVTIAPIPPIVLRVVEESPVETATGKKGTAAAKAEPKEKARPVATAKAKPVVKTKPIAKTKLTTKTKLAAKTKPTAKTKPVVKTRPALKTKPAVKTKPVAKTKPVVKTNPTAKTKAAAKTRLVVKTKATARTKPVAKTKPIVKAKPAVRAVKTKPVVKAAKAKDATSPRTKTVKTPEKGSRLSRALRAIRGGRSD